MQAIVGGRVMTPFDEYSPGTVLVCGSRIAYAGSSAGVVVPKEAQVFDASGLLVAPGFIDIHTHGFGGVLFGSASTLHEFRVATQGMARTGVTSCFATIGALGPMDRDFLRSSIRRCREATQSQDRHSGTRLIGLHLEGPFLSSSKPGASKAWTREFRAAEAVALAGDLLAEAGGLVRLVVVAPEIPGATQIAELCRSAGSLVSIGHTDATYDEALFAIRKGFTHVTHTYNAMRGLHHRDPGVVGATLRSKDVTNEIIADGHHVHPAALWLCLQCKPRERVVLITDGSGLGGLPDGEYMLPGAVPVTVSGSRCSLSDGTIAGSVMPANQQLRMLVDLCGIPTGHAIQLMTANPALEFGLLQKGTIAPGKDADIVVLAPDFSVRQVYIEGEPLYP